MRLLEKLQSLKEYYSCNKYPNSSACEVIDEIERFIEKNKDNVSFMEYNMAEVNVIAV